MDDSTLREAFAGVPDPMSEMMNGFRLISGKHLRYVALLLKETEMVFLGLQPSSCLTQEMEAPHGQLIWTPMARKW